MSGGVERAVPGIERYTLRIVVAPDGTDDAQGTDPAPIRTLEEAQRRVRAHPGSAAVVLREGTWHLTRPLRFSGADSGSPQTPAVWAAAPGAHPVISGGIPVAEWRLHDERQRIYRAEVAGISDTRQLYVDDRSAERSWVPLERDQVEVTVDGLNIRDDALGYLAELPSASRIEVDSVGSFTHRYSPVERIERTRILMQQPAWRNNNWGYDTFGAPFEGGALRLLNAYAFLQPGQWYFEPADRALYYRALEGDDPEAHHFVVPVLESLIEVAGTLDDPVHDIVFSGLRFSHTSWLLPSSSTGYASQQAGTFLAGTHPQPPDFLETCQKGCRQFEATRNDWRQVPAAVQVAAATRIDFVGNTFAHLGQVGLGIGCDANANAAGIGLAASDVLVRHNLFTHLAGGGIVVGGVGVDAHHPSDPRMTVRDVVIDNNLVTDVAIDYRESAGILATYVDGVVITHNEVSHLAYDGIDVGFGWGANDPGGSPDYLERGLYEFQPAYATPTTLRGAIVANNLVHHTKKSFHDGGSIYTLSANPGARIRENYVRDNNTSVGLYLDEGSRFIELEQNVVQDAPVWVFTNTYGVNNTDDNRFIGNWYNGGRTHMPDPERHRNRLVGNTLVDGYDWPIDAQMVIFNAGLEEQYRTFPGATRRTQLGAFLERVTGTDASDTEIVVSLTLANFGSGPVTAIQASPMELPAGWSARRADVVPSTLAAHERVHVRWVIAATSRAQGAIAQRISAMGDGGRIEKSAHCELD